MKARILNIALGIGLGLSMQVQAAPIMYFYDYTMLAGESFPDTQYINFDDDTQLNGSVSISGFVETDGTLGSIDESNILSWEFTITTLLGGYTFSNQPLVLNTPGRPNSDDVTTEGVFNATATRLSAIGDYQFYNEPAGFRNNGETLFLGTWFNISSDSFFNGNPVDSLVINVNEYSCTQAFDIASCDFGTQIDRQSELFFVAPRGGLFVGNTRTVPLPSAALLILLGLALLALVDRRRKATALNKAPPSPLDHRFSNSRFV